MNLVPFDMEKWKQGWKPYTRDGYEVKGLRGDALLIEWSDYPLKGYVNRAQFSWAKDGSFKFGQTGNHSDLMLAEPEPEREWLYINPTRTYSARQYHCDHLLFWVSERRPDGSWRVLSSEEMEQVMREEGTV